MIASTTFGPFSRFRIDPVFVRGDLTAFDLFDAEAASINGIAQRIGRYRFACDAFASAAQRVPHQWRQATADGARFVPCMTAEPHNPTHPEPRDPNMNAKTTSTSPIWLILDGVTGAIDDIEDRDYRGEAAEAQTTGARVEVTLHGLRLVASFRDQGVEDAQAYSTGGGDSEREALDDACSMLTRLIRGIDIDGDALGDMRSRLSYEDQVTPSMDEGDDQTRVYVTVRVFGGAA